VTDMKDDNEYDVETPSRLKICMAIFMGASTVIIFSSLIFVLVYSNDGFRGFFYDTSIGIGDFAVSLLMVFVWCIAGYMSGKTLLTGTRWGFISGAAAGFLGQCIVSIIILFFDSPYAFPPEHHLLYVIFAALITAISATFITYNNETILYLKELEESEEQP